MKLPDLLSPFQTRFLNTSLGKVSAVTDNYQKFFSDKALDLLMKVYSSDQTAIQIHYIGIGQTGTNANNYVRNHYLQVLLPATKGHLSFTSVQEINHFVRDTGTIYRCFPDLLVITVDASRPEDMSLALSVGRYSVRNKILTVLVISCTSENCFANNAIEPRLYDAAHAVYTIPASNLNSHVPGSGATNIQLHSFLLALSAKLLLPGFVCVDFVDFKQTLFDNTDITTYRPRRLVCGFGTGKGRQRAENAIQLALINTGLDWSRTVPSGIWLVIRTDESFSINEMEKAIDYLKAITTVNTPVAAGDYFDKLSDDIFEVSIIVSLFCGKHRRAK